MAFYCMGCGSKNLFSVSHQGLCFCPPLLLASNSPSGDYLGSIYSPWNGNRAREAEGRVLKVADLASLSAFLFPSVVGEFSFWGPL